MPKYGISQEFKYFRVWQKSLALKGLEKKLQVLAGMAGGHQRFQKFLSGGGLCGWRPRY